MAITGFNGIGKSTLLKTLMGEVPALGGSFVFAPQTKIGYYAQDFCWQDDSFSPLEVLLRQAPQKSVKELRRILAQCGITGDMVNAALHTLSGGEQAKVKVSLLLLESYHLLILDEPTNHLDREAKEALQEAIRAFPGSLILVTHEESFYVDWADKVLEIDQIGK